MSNRGAGAVRAPFALYSSRVFFPLVVVATHDNIPVFLPQSHPILKMLLAVTLLYSTLGLELCMTFIRRMHCIEYYDGLIVTSACSSRNETIPVLRIAVRGDAIKCVNKASINIIYLRWSLYDRTTQGAWSHQCSSPDLTSFNSWASLTTSFCI